MFIWHVGTVLPLETVIGSESVVCQAITRRGFGVALGGRWTIAY
jgi:hypothetical protein